MTPLDFGEIAAGMGVMGAFLLWVVQRVVSEAVLKSVNGFKADMRVELALLKQSVDRLTRDADRRAEAGR